MKLFAIGFVLGVAVGGICVRIGIYQQAESVGPQSVQLPVSGYVPKSAVRLSSIPDEAPLTERERYRMAMKLQAMRNMEVLRRLEAAQDQQEQLDRIEENVEIMRMEQHMAEMQSLNAKPQ
jgi:hypothetical protein